MPAFAIRDEQESDAAAIRAVTLAAFANKPYSQQTEAAIVEALRAAAALDVSLVAVEGADVVGHVAFSPVSINGAAAPRMVWHRPPLGAPGAPEERHRFGAHARRDRAAAEARRDGMRRGWRSSVL